MSVPPWLLFKVTPTVFANLLIVQVSENWDDDFEFPVEKRKMTTSTAKSEATEDDFENSHQSPKKRVGMIKTS
jgi:hypothetical protein